MEKKRIIVTIIISVIITIIGTVIYNLPKEESFVSKIKGGISHYNASGTVRTMKLTRRLCCIRMDWTNILCR